MSAPAGRLPATDFVVRHPSQRAASRSHPYASPAPRTHAPHSLGLSQELSPIAGPSRQLTPQVGRYDGPQPSDEPPYEAEGHGQRWVTNHGGPFMVGPSPGGTPAPGLAPGNSVPIQGPAPPPSDQPHNAEIAARYPLYAPPTSHHGQYTGAPARSVGASDLERAITRYKLNHRRTDIYNFQSLDLDGKLNTIFTHLIKLEEMHAGLQAQCEALDGRFNTLEKLCEQAWQPSKAQTKLIRSLIRHYLVKPISSYSGLPGCVKRYIKANPGKFRLELYTTDSTVRTTVNTHVNDLVSQMKSAFRKAVFASCKSQISLQSFARNMLDNYHLPAIPAEAPLSILGTLAMMRKIANPLAQTAQRGRGGDTGFWRAVDAALDEQYKATSSKDRDNDAGWIDWAKAKVEEDRALFSTRRTGRRSRRSNVPASDDEDIGSLNLGEDAGTENHDSGLVNPGTPTYADAQLPDLEDVQEQEDEDLPDLNTMGDIASTIPIA
ncbi:hypothetical protein OH77DRAFT_1416538 [Trametes cingulata]|nr:hypothetical protein OH77DRAFT_1416538 [Trametes cingulata]